MRILFFLVWIFTSASMQAQTKLPAAELDYLQQAKQSKHSVVADSIIPKKKWFVTSYAGLASSFSFFKGGNATVLSVPLILQINHRLSNNLYAFAAVSAAPAYVNFSGNYNYMTPIKSGQQNNFMQSPSLGIYSKAELGLMYVNDAKTFSISASVGVSKSNYPMLPVYPLNTFGGSPVFSSRR